MLRRTILVVLALAACAALPAVASAATTLNVSATSSPAGYNGTGPTHTGVTVSAGEQLTVSATGTWYVCGGCGYGPDGEGLGYANGSPAPAQQASNFSLIGSTDGGATWFAVGSGPTTVTGSGELLLAMNDWGFDDNYGSLSVSITRETIAPPDSDGDGIPDAQDNCPNDSNAGQADLDNDGTGDACDNDIDGDGVANANDAFPNDVNEQKDSDGDGVGDNADAFPNDASETADADGDGVGNNADNCPNDANQDQADLDGDGQGDACDGDIDGDGVANGSDAFPTNASESKDTDGDGIGDNADRFPNDPNESTDADNDGVGDGADNCPNVSNAGQGDLDGDGIGDACDSDIDGDGVPNSSDNAPLTANADQADLDRDGIGDVIDTKVLPLSADACKRNGWPAYHDGAARFKNQGDCVSYVATGGKNGPAGS